MASRMEVEGVPPLRERTNITIEEKMLAKGNNVTLQERQPGSPTGTAKGKLSLPPTACFSGMLDLSPDVCCSHEADGHGEKDIINTSKPMSLTVANSKDHPTATNMTGLVGQRPPQILQENRSGLEAAVKSGDKTGPSALPAKNKLLDRVKNEERLAIRGMIGRHLSSSILPVSPLVQKKEAGPTQKTSSLSVAPLVEKIKNVSAQSSLSSTTSPIGASEENLKYITPNLPEQNPLPLTNLSITPSVEKVEELPADLPAQDPQYSTAVNIENIPAETPAETARRGPVTNRRSRRPPVTKQTVRNSSIDLRDMPNGGSPDDSGPLVDDYEELVAAANSARDASSRACRQPFWRYMECVFGPVSSQDELYLKNKLNFFEQLTEGSYQTPQDGDNASAETESPANQESVCTGGDFATSTTITLSQRLVAALIEEDGEELNLPIERKNNCQYTSDDSHSGSCNPNDLEPKDRDAMESNLELVALRRSQKRGLVGRSSCDKNFSPNTDSNRSISSSVCNNEPCQQEDGLSCTDAEAAPLIRHSDLGFSHSPRINPSPGSTSINQYQTLSANDRLLLELQYVGLSPEAEEEESIDKEIAELGATLYQQSDKTKSVLGKLCKAVQRAKDEEKRNMEEVAFDKLIEMAYRRRMVSRGNSGIKMIRRVSTRVASGFADRTLKRCQEFEETGKSCFSEGPLHDILYSAPPSNSVAKPPRSAWPRTATNKSRKPRNRASERRGEGSTSQQKYASTLEEPVPKRRKRKDVLLNVVSTATGASPRTEDGNAKMVTNNTVSDNFNSAQDTVTSVCISEWNSKQKGRYALASGSEPSSSSMQPAPAAGQSASVPVVANLSNRNSEVPNEENAKEEGKETDLKALSPEQLPELGSFEDEDFSTLLDLDEEGLKDQDLQGLEVPMDNLSDIHMFI